MTLKNFVVFLGEAQPKNRACISEVRASFVLCFCVASLRKRRNSSPERKNKTIYQPSSGECAKQLPFFCMDLYRCIYAFLQKACKTILLFLLIGFFFINGEKVLFAKQNLLCNGGFEVTTVDNFPDCWDQFLGPKKNDYWDNFWEIDNDIYYSGKQSLRLTIPDKSYICKVYAENWLCNRLLKFLNEPLLAKQKQYILSLYLRSDQQNMRVKLKYFGKVTYLAVKDSWAKYTISCMDLDYNQHLFIIPEQQGILWIDNVKFEAGSEATNFEEAYYIHKIVKLPESQTRQQLNDEIHDVKLKLPTPVKYHSAIEGNIKIDSEKRCITINGKPFFYFGACFLKAHQFKERWRNLLSQLKEMGYTLVTASFTAPLSLDRASLHEIISFLNLAKEKKLKVVIWIQPNAKNVNGTLVNVRELPANEVLDEFKKEVARLIPSLKNHPALLAWYVCDEPWRQTWIDIGFAKQLIDYARILDKKHPIFINYANPQKHYVYFDGYVPGDIISETLYPIPTNPITVVGRDAALNIYMSNSQKPAMFWYQFWSGKGRYPTPDEFKCMIYLSLIYGHTAFQTWPIMPNVMSLWSSIKQITNELRTLQPFIYSSENIPLTLKTDQFIYAAAKQDQDKIYVVAVNTDKEMHSASISFKEKVYADHTEVLFEERSILIKDNKIQDTFLPYERHVYVLDTISDHIMSASDNIRFLYH